MSLPSVATTESSFARRFAAQALGRGIAAQTNRLSLTAFKQALMPSIWQDARHLQLLDEHLTQVMQYLLTDGKQGINRLMIFMPPRYGKSLTVSQYFPAWALGNKPSLKIIMASYGARLAYRNSRRVRSVVNDNRYQQLYPTRLNSDKAAQDEWETVQGGAVIAAGVGGGITGHGANLVIIDDPHKGRAEAESATTRETIENWYKGDLYTRLEQPNVIILMMTRWHHQDLAGWLLSDNADNWTVLSLPALATGNDWRGEGEALYPVLHDVAKLTSIREAIGEYDFAALYQQQPIPAAGRLFDAGKIEIVDTLPEVAQTVRFWDLAVTAKRHADYTVGLKLGITRDEKLVIMDVWRGQRELPDVHEAIVQMAKMDAPETRVRLEAEKAGIVELQHLLRDPRMRGISIDGEPPRGDKFTRAGPVAARVNAGCVMMHWATWNKALLDELALFPNAPHDDQVDALSGAYAMMTGKRGITSSIKRYA